MSRLALRVVVVRRSDRTTRDRLVRDRRCRVEELQRQPDERIRGESGRLVGGERLLRGAAVGRRHDARYKLSYSGLEAPVTQSHIHFGKPAVNGGISIWLCERGRPVTRCQHADLPAGGHGQATHRGRRGRTGWARESPRVNSRRSSPRCVPATPTPTCTPEVPRRRDPRAAQEQRRRPIHRRRETTRRRRPDSRRAITSSVNAAARAPSTTRWSNVTETLPIWRTTISPSRTTGRGPIRCRPRIPT